MSICGQIKVENINHNEQTRAKTHIQFMLKFTICAISHIFFDEGAQHRDGLGSGELAEAAQPVIERALGDEELLRDLRTCFAAAQSVDYLEICYVAADKTVFKRNYLVHHLVRIEVEGILTNIFVRVHNVRKRLKFGRAVRDEIRADADRRGDVRAVFCQIIP